MQFIYTLESSSTNIENINDLYVKVILSEHSLTIPNDADGNPYTGQNLLNWYKKIFAKVYIFDSAENKFKEATVDDLSEQLYYIPKPNLDKYVVSTKYQVDNINDIVMVIDKDSLSGTRYDDYTLANINDFKKVQKFVINGIEVSGFVPEDFNFVDDSTNKTRTFTNDNIHVVLPNGVEITEIRFCVKEVSLPSKNPEVTWNEIYHKLQYVELKNIYKVGEENKKYLNNYVVKESTSQQSYTLSVKSKAVVYENFMESGYWKVGKNFLLNADYENTTKYLINLEYASIYLWNTFVDTSIDLDTGDLIYNLLRPMQEGTRSHPVCLN